MYQIIRVTGAEFLLKNFCSEKSSGEVEEKFHGRKSKQFRQSHRTAVREVISVNSDAMFNLLIINQNISIIQFLAFETWS